MRTPGVRPRIGIGVVAGAIAGVFGGFVKLGWEVPFPPRPPGRLPEPQVLLQHLMHGAPPEWGTLAIHFAFSTVAGAVYGGLVEAVPAAALGIGAGYGIAVWLGAHEVVMPLLGLTPPTPQLSLGEQSSEFFGHAVWGVGLELVRAGVRSSPVALDVLRRRNGRETGWITSY